jgi:hypothetical protein
MIKKSDKSLFLIQEFDLLDQTPSVWYSGRAVKQQVVRSF